MAGDETLLGEFTDASGEDFEVIAKGKLVLLRGDQCSTVLLGPEARAELAELLQRAAMPGQPGVAEVADPKHDPVAEWAAGDDSAIDAQIRADDRMAP